MKIIFENAYKEIKNIVNQKAKYQKVMLIYDDSVSRVEISKIYDEIKELCVYNELQIVNINNDELNDGYRLLIFLCSAESFVSANINTDEFANIFVPQSEEFFPFYVSHENVKNKSDDYIILKQGKIDVSAISSVYFNKFYNYLKDLYTRQTSNMEFDFVQKEITQLTCLNMLKSVNESFEFLDVKIIKEMKIEVEFLPAVDFLLLNAFIVLISAVRNKTLALVDVYKSAKEDYDLVDKFYAMTYNESFLNLLKLNYNCLFNICLKTKEKLMEIMDCHDLTNEIVLMLIDKIRLFSKNQNGIISYLYLFNVFDT